METRRSQPETALHVTVLYDDLDAGILAKDIHDRICAGLPAGTATRLTLWPFVALENSRRRLACDDLADANVVIVAADGAYSLPSAVQETLEECFTTREPTRIGLAAILYRVQEHEKELSPAHASLQALARKAGADFFCQTIPAPAQNDPASSRTRRPLTIDFVVEDDSFSASVSIDHWGLNE